MQSPFSFNQFLKQQNRRIINFDENLDENIIKRKIQTEYLFKWEFQYKSLSGLIIIERVSKKQQHLQIEINQLEQIKKQMDGKVTYTGFADHYEILGPLYQDKIFLCRNIFTGLNQVAKFCDNENSQQKKLSYFLSDNPNKNILSINEMFEENEKIIFISDYYEPGNLQDYFIKVKLMVTLTQIKSIIKSILQGLKHLHENKIIHRDVKLTNIMIVDQFNLKSLKIIDFEFATFFDKSINQECGTEGYKAPEMVKKHKYNEKCDIYSAGIIFYILLFGQRPKTIPNFDIQKIGFFSEEKSQYEIALDLLKSMLEEDPGKRLSAHQCLEHQLFQKVLNQSDPSISKSISGLSSIRFHNPFIQYKSFS